MSQYEKILKYLGKLEDGKLELKKDIVYKGKENECCVIVYGVKSVKDKVDMVIH